MEIEHANASIQFHHPLKCEICGVALSFPETLQLKALGYNICHSFECRRIMSQKSLIPTALFQSQVNVQQKIRKERQAREEARQKYSEEALVREREENRAILKMALSEFDELTEADVKVVDIPSGNGRLVSLASERIDLYRSHLQKIVNEAFAQKQDIPTTFADHQDIHDKLIEVEKRFEEIPWLRQISDQICGICKGGCCVAGNEHAYLSPITVKRYIDVNQEVTEAEMLEMYIAKLARKTIDGACINQSESGCVLPKELRSDICNSYYCESLRDFHLNTLVKESNNPVLVIQREAANWNRYVHYMNNEVVQIVLVTENEGKRLEFSKQNSKQGTLAVP